MSNSNISSPSFRVLFSMMLAFVIAGTFAAPNESAAAGYDRTCGILPGDGYFSYVRVANMSCRHGKKVAFKARKKFCNARRDCFMRTDTKIYRGQVRRNGWKCKVTVGWEYLRVKCRRGNERTIYRGGA